MTTIKKLKNGDFQISYKNENGNVEVINQGMVNENIEIIATLSDIFRTVEEILPPRGSIDRK